MSLAGLLKQTVSVLTPGSQASTEYGGWTDTVTGVTYAASVQVDTSRESMDYERQTKKRTFSIYLAPTATIPINSRVSVTSGAYTGTLIEVFAAKADHAGRGTYWMLRGTEVL